MPEKNPPIPEWEEAIASFTKKDTRLAILGIGRRDKGDDGIGSRIAADLISRFKSAKNHQVLIIDTGASPENFTGILRSYAPSHVLIIDAANGGKTSGDIFVISEGKVREEELTTHRLPLSLLERYLRAELKCRVLLVGIQPGDFAQGNRLSPPVRKTFRELMRFLQKRLGRIPAERNNS